MQDFIYNTPTTVYFGRGKEKEVGRIIASYGYKKIMMQYGKSSIKSTGLYDVVIEALNEQGIEVVEKGGVEPNPKIEFVREAIKIAKEQKVEFILAVGGGSVIDSCKYTALGAKYDGDVWDFPTAKATPNDALPVGCILTMSAAGSEMSNSAVVTDLSKSEKRGCSTEFNRCKFAIMNPELTFSVNKYQTACGVADIMAHTMERYFTLFEPTLLTDRIAESVLKTVIEAGRIAVNNPTDYDARANIMWASSLSHNGLTACGRENYLAVHQIEHALSGEYDYVAHGAGLAVLFPAWAKYVYKYKPERFAQFARNVWGVVEDDDVKASELGIQKMADYFKEIGLQAKISDFDIPKESLQNLAQLCFNTKNRPVKSYILLGVKEIKEILELCY